MFRQRAGSWIHALSAASRLLRTCPNELLVLNRMSSSIIRTRADDTKGSLKSAYSNLNVTLLHSCQQPRHFTLSPTPASAKTKQEEIEEDACVFIQDRGYSREVAEGIVATLKAPGSGCAPSEVLSMVKLLAGRWEVGEDAGLAALALAVQNQRAQLEGKALVNLTVNFAGDGRSFTVEGYEGMSIADIVHHGEGKGASQLAEVMECACGAIMACSTCQVVIDPEWYDRVGAPDEDEQDMLDLAYDPQPTSRLGCQIVLTKELDGLKMTIPSAANNMFDHIPFE
eukprot:CAMPEP_0197864076 /NCGR_PEP_ID=MMETSP1438-20131217/42009_1 /TAXON_ID=1461541 /ORGANISM="Pterosperma sp., Strain CCMP1384" /LENGTH=283 /DNA_ID=CAMNT_0043482183 /DNA_START=381 /DNA_END=1232 /DNA_ORIENTATION=+